MKFYSRNPFSQISQKLIERLKIDLFVYRKSFSEFHLYQNQRRDNFSTIL